MWDLIAGAFIVAIIFMLVRPNSPGGKAVVSFSDALANLIATATGTSLQIKQSDGSTKKYGYSGTFLPNPNG